MLVFIGSLVLVAISAFIQMTNWMLISAAIKPNLLFVVLVVLMTLNPNWIKRLILILVAVLIIKEIPGILGITLSHLIFVSAALIATILLDILPWQRTINTLVAVVAGTLIINLQYFTLLPVTFELALNLLLAFILLNLLQPINVRQIKLQRHRF